MRDAFAVLLVLHGAVHLIGVFRPTTPSSPVPPASARAWWLIAAILLIAGSLLVGFSRRSWVFAAGPGVLLSQILIFSSWSDARFGTLVNLVVAVPLIVAIADRRPNSLRVIFERESARALAAEPTNLPAIITESDLDGHPEIIRRFLRRSGAIGHARVRNFRLTFAAQMRGGPDESWMDATAEQYEFFHPPTRLFFMRASRSGVPFDVLHRYKGDSATMDVRIAGLYSVQHLAGSAMTRSETVTLFNDICLLAPAALLEVPVEWNPMSDTAVEGTFANAGHTIRAILTFSPQGDLLNFTSDDRAMAQGDTMLPLPFSTPVLRLAEFDGLLVVADGEARYRQHGVEWAYGRFQLTSMQFNVH